MNYAVIRDKTVCNVIIASENVVQELSEALLAEIVCVDGVECQIGWTTNDNGQTFVDPNSILE